MRSTHLAYVFGLPLVALVGCATSDSSAPADQTLPAGDQEPMRGPGPDPGPSHTPIPTTTGTFAGRYYVPVPPDLSLAAQFTVPEVAWTVLDGVATLHYDLPVGLVGGDLSVTLSGTIAAGATQLQLTGGSSTGSCTAQGTIIRCNEVFGDLGDVPVNATVVERAAAADHVSATDRMQVATLFGNDPIGSVEIDVSTIGDNHGDDSDDD
jgi:hypothetical protein